MDAYIYQAALLCDDCADAVNRAGASDSDDSDDCPQGPYCDGGGEADSPQHCDHCNVFLENPLTSEGYEYVRSAITEMYCRKGGRSERGVVAEWKEYYGGRIGR